MLQSTDDAPLDTQVTYEYNFQHTFSSLMPVSCLTNRGACWDLGFRDWVLSGAECQKFCQLNSNCQYWSWHPKRSNTRCHFSANPNCANGHCASEDCEAGPAVCPGNTRLTATILLSSAMTTAAGFCTDSAIGDGAKYLEAATDINQVATQLETYIQSSGSDFVTALESAHQTGLSMLSSSCSNTRTACNRGSILWVNIMALLLTSGFNGYPQVPISHITFIYTYRYYDIVDGNRCRAVLYNTWRRRDLNCLGTTQSLWSTMISSLPPASIQRSLSTGNCRSICLKRVSDLVPTGPL